MRPPRHSQGLTLIELLVSISIGLVVTGAMLALYLGTARSYRQLDALAQLQSNARYVFEIMGHDIRMAGNRSCQVPGLNVPVNYVSNPASNWWSNTDRPLFGQDETTDGNAVGDANFPADYKGQALRGDTLIVLRMDPDDATPAAVASYNNPATGLANPLILRSGSFSVGSLLLLTDCSTTVSLFQMTGSSGGVQHGMPTSSAPNMSGAKIVPLSAHAYHLRNSGRRYPSSSSFIPSLFRQNLTTSASAPATVAEELVGGVTDLQIRYGVDTSASPAGVIGSYLSASEINAAGYSWTDPNRVLAVRVTVTLESADDNVNDVSRSFTLGNGAVISDRRLRRSYTMTFGIRQRMS